MRRFQYLPILFVLSLTIFSSCETSEKETYTPVRSDDYISYIASNYDKREVLIPMRDGTQLFTAIYTPKDSSQSFPMMLFRTPY